MLQNLRYVTYVHRNCLWSRETDVQRSTSAADIPAEVDIAIVGSGFSGLGMAIRLKQEGHEDFVVLERGRRRRRHLALQHLPRLRLRRPLAPLLLLLRAQSRLEPDLLAPAARSAPTCAAAPTTSAFAPTSASGTRSPAPPGTRTPSAGRSRRRAGRCARACSSPAWAPSPSRRSPTSRASSASRAPPSTPPAGTTTTT